MIFHKESRQIMAAFFVWNHPRCPTSHYSKSFEHCLPEEVDVILRNAQNSVQIVSASL